MVEAGLLLASQVSIEVYSGRPQKLAPVVLKVQLDLAEVALRSPVVLQLQPRRPSRTCLEIQLDLEFEV